MAGEADHAGPGDVATLDELEAVLDGAALLGLELDTRFRVLAATLEPTADRYPWGSGVGGVEIVDRRVQLLASPVSTILGSLRRERDSDDEPPELLTFTEEQLVDVVAALDAPPVTAPLFGRPEPRPGAWAPRWSLEGRSTAGDGVTRTLTISVQREEHDGTLELDLFARFDELLVKDPFGTDLASFGPPGLLGLADG